jgi:type 2 lantibiotic biosynthesis protein LanM
MTELAAAYGRATAATVSSPLPAALQHARLAGFLNVVAPLIDAGCARLRRDARTLLQPVSGCAFEAATIDTLMLETLPGALLRMLGRTLVLELNAQRLDGVLHGATPEARFESFVDGLRRPRHALEMLQAYPVLGRLVVGCIDNWVTNSLEFLRHLSTDWDDIRTTLCGGADPGPLAAVEGNLGDRHRGGRAVLRARFASGVEVVYKPRSLAVDVHFQELLAWLNDRGAEPAFRTLAIVDRPDHGWVELVHRRSCTSTAEVERFYQRHGGSLAVLYALEAADFHCENVIASGEHPLLLDLEGLFHPRIGAAGSAAPSASEALAQSVMRIGLLPERVWSQASHEAIDISGIGAVSGQLSADAVPQWEGIGTDTMRFTRKRVAVQERVNRPVLNGVEVDTTEYGDALVTGFTRIYQLLLRHRDALVADDGPLSRFAADQVRVIVRPTRIYAKMLEDSFHPDILRDARDHERFLDRLRVGIDICPHLARTIPAEHEDLRNGDIPLFTTQPGSRDVWTSAGERLPDLLAEPALTSARRRVGRLSSHDLDRQRWLVRASLSTLSIARPQTPRIRSAPVPSRGQIDRERLVAAAATIGRQLEASALHGRQSVSWIGLSPRDERHWSIAPLGLDLYDGLPGVALFLGYLGSVTGEIRFAAFARAALSTLRRDVQNGGVASRSIGAFTGGSGVAYVLGQLGALWNRPDLLSEAAALVDVLSGRLDDDRSFDVVDGAAGCIGSLLALHALVPDAATLALATRCGDHLLGHARVMPQGIGWIPWRSDTALAGFAHGAAGIAWALSKLAAATGERRFQTAAVEAIAYERTLFTPEAQNWLDLRPSSDAGATGPRTHMTAWCHGAGGIGLARLDSLAQLDDARTRAEIELATQTVVTHGLGGSHCLCHGDLGNVELLLASDRASLDGRWTSIVDRTAAAVLDDIALEGCSCGTPLGVETPGLMTGLAGIGYGLLRLAHPDFVPSVLVLEPHRAGSAPD